MIRPTLNRHGRRIELREQSCSVELSPRRGSMQKELTHASARLREKPARVSFDRVGDLREGEATIVKLVKHTSPKV